MESGQRLRACKLKRMDRTTRTAVGTLPPVLMAKFDVYRGRADGVLLLDCQADLLDDLSTRLVVPLLVEQDAPRPAARLNPVFELNEQRYVMVTQFAAAILVRDLGERIVSLISEQDRVNLALDMLITGF